MNEPYDIAIAGSGFAGSLLAMIAQRLGRRVVLLERGKHPRVVIGESSTPLSNLLLEELSTKYGLPHIKPLAKWGSWQQTNPEIACGLKRGFTFFHHEPGRQDSPVADRSRQLLVSASPHNGIADTHWYRADFDHFLIEQARQSGVEYLDEVDLKKCVTDGDEIHLQGERNGQNIKLTARFVIDATGPRGFLHKALSLGEHKLTDFPPTQALYSHFSGVGQIPEPDESEDQPPYPVNAAAVHHIFENGWAWVLQFNNGLTSAGVAATDVLANHLKFQNGAQAWEQLLQQIPDLRKQFANAKPVQPFRHIRQLAFRSAEIVGHNWALLPSAAGFVDPLLSTGFPLTLLGVARLAEIIERDWRTENFQAQLEQYAAQSDAELLATARLVAALYANMGNFRVFAALSLLYFAAASYAETARRLGKPYLASSFLLHDHPHFGPECARLFDQIRSGMESEALVKKVFQMIEPIDVAGLSDRARRNWYPVEAEDLLRSSHKVGASPSEILQMLERCGFAPATSPASV